MDLFVAAGRRGPRRTLPVLVALAGLLVAAAGPAAGPARAAASGSVVVTVVGADTGTALEGVCADASSSDPDVPGNSGCAEPGQTEVVLGGLVDGAEYVVNVTVGGFTGYLPPVVSTQTVVAPADVVFTAQRAVVVTGSLQYADGTLPRTGIVVMDPVPGPAVPFPPSGFIQSGRYEVRVPAGDYTIRFQDSATGVSQWAVGATSAADATVFTAVEGVPLVVDDTLLTGSGGVPVPGTVSGRVTDAVTGEPVAGVCPFLVGELDRPTLPASCEDLGVAPTAADGTYSLEVDSGDYQLWPVDPAGRYALSRLPVTVTPRGTTVRDVALAVGGEVSGRAVDASSGTPLPDLCVEVSVARTPQPTGTPTCTDADGRWTTAQVLPGPVTVRVLGDATHVTQWAPGGDTQTQARATVFAVAPGAATSAGTVRMPRGATLTGRVTDRRGRPVVGAWVVVGPFDWRADGEGGGGPTASTDVDGRYTIPNVPQQRQIATVYVPNQPFAWQWSGRATDPARAERLVLRYGRTTRLDVELAPEGVLAVDVTAPVTPPAQVAAELDAVTPSGALVGFGEDVPETAVLSLRGIPTSKVRLRVTVGRARTVLWYVRDGVLSADPARAAAVQVVGGRTKTVRVTVPG